MILYKKMVRFYSIFNGGMGFKDEITPITNWMDEDKISEEDKKKIEETKNNLLQEYGKKQNMFSLRRKIKMNGRNPVLFFNTLMQ